MGLLSVFRREKALTADPAVIESIQNRTSNFIIPLGGSNVSSQMRAAVQRAQDASYAWMYAYQPSVRSVVNLIAENVAQLSLKLYERISDDDRRHDSDHPAALTMRYPNAVTPADLFVQEITCDWLVHDNAYCLKFPRGGGQPLTLVRLLPHMVGVLGQGYAVTGYRVYRTDGSFEDFPPERVMHWRSPNPQDPRLGVSRLETLRQELVQETATQSAITELARNGLSGGYIKRPLEAPEWSAEGKERFLEGWRKSRKASPRQTPVLEEGMEFLNTMISPKDAELLASRQFTLETVAQVYGVPVGLLTVEGDQEQQLKRLYADVLTPVSRKLSSQLDHSILQAEYMATDYYYEFDVASKLKGDLENRFPALTASVGAPWMTRNEARAKENLPPIPEGDEIITPLNVLVGDNPRPAPNVMPIQDPNGPPQDGSHRTGEEDEEESSLEPAAKFQQLLPRRAGLENRRDEEGKTYTAVLRRHFNRQKRAHLRRPKTAKAVDDSRWNEELAEDLFTHSRQTVSREGGIAAARMLSEFDPARTFNYLAEKARDASVKINRATAKEISDVGTRDALDYAVSVRAVATGTAYATDLFAWSTKEALHQMPDSGARMVNISGGQCDICAPYQGVWRPDDVPEWPPYHGNCNCIAEAG